MTEGELVRASNPDPQNFVNSYIHINRSSVRANQDKIFTENIFKRNNRTIAINI